MDSPEPTLVKAAEALRELILAGESYRQVVNGFLKLDTSETSALSYLYSRGEMGPSELGSLLGLNTSTMTAVIDRLERDGIAKRRPHPTDRRRRVVYLTPDGRQSIDSLAQWFVGAFDHVGPGSLPALTAALADIAADLRIHTLGLFKNSQLAAGSESF